MGEGGALSFSWAFLYNSLCCNSGSLWVSCSAMKKGFRRDKSKILIARIAGFREQFFPSPYRVKVLFTGLLQVSQLQGYAICGQVPPQYPRMPREWMLTFQKANTPESHWHLVWYFKGKLEPNMMAHTSYSYLGAWGRGIQSSRVASAT